MLYLYVLGFLFVIEFIPTCESESILALLGFLCFWVLCLCFCIKIKNVLLFVFLFVCLIILSILHYVLSNRIAKQNILGFNS